MIGTSCRDAVSLGSGEKLKGILFFLIQEFLASSFVLGEVF